MNVSPLLMIQRILSFLLALCLVFQSVPPIVWAAPLPEIGFKATLSINHTKPNVDKLSIQGTFRLGPGAEAAPSTEEVALSVGPFSQTIIPPAFTRRDTRRTTTWTFKAPRGSSGLTQMTLTKTGEAWTFKARAQGLNLSGTANPITVTFRVGDDAGSRTHYFEVKEPKNRKKKMFRFPPGDKTDADGDGISSKAGDCDDQDPDIHPGATERCNDLDDDCDDEFDEGFTIGAACAAGQGACERTGMQVCAADGLGTMCDAVPALPSSETCNGLDDDCNGAADNGFDLGTACSAGIGACERTGAKLCALDGQSTICSAAPGAPGAEICGNGMDEDCDGDDPACPEAGPFISAITPSGASFGDRITIAGSGFGTDPSIVKVRFAYSENGETLTVDQPAFSVTPSSIDVGVPMAVPDRTNQVQVLVGLDASPAVDFFVGQLPPDPSPDEAGNETIVLLADLQALVAQFDGRLDTFFGTTNTLSPAELDQLHQKFAELQSLLGAFAGDIQGEDEQIRHVLDVFAGSDSWTLLRAKLQSATNALQGSPDGNVMCESQDFHTAVAEVLSVLGVIHDVIDAVITTLTTACALSIIGSIFSLGIASPIAAVTCTAAASAALTIVQAINDAIEVTMALVNGVNATAPADLVPGGYAVRVRHPQWGLSSGSPEPSAVYVNGSQPVEVRAFHAFENARCNPSTCSDDDALNLTCVPVGCSFNATVHILGVPIDFAFVVPHQTVELPLRSALAFAPGRNTLADAPGSNGVVGFTGAGMSLDEETSFFSGLDVNGPAWERGLYPVEVSSSCSSSNPVLGPVQKEYPLVAGPKLLSVTPSSAQLGSLIELQGQYLPPLASGSTGAIFQGLATPEPMQSTAANSYTLLVPDVPQVDTTIRLQVNGRDSDALPFTVLPPTLDVVQPSAGFAGETIEVQGTGFARSLGNMVLELAGSPVSIAGTGPSGGLLFQVPAVAAGGNLQLTAVGAHVSNLLPFGIASWTAPALLSHPARDAANPVLAVHPFGSVGVAWIDRRQDGGKVRLLFTDAAPGDAAFRAPIEITADLIGPPLAPQQPDLAVEPGFIAIFHLVWINEAGAIQLASFAKGATPGAPVTVASPDPGMTFRDPKVAVMTDGSVHVVALGVPLDATPYNSLAHIRSADGGITFEPPVELHGPNLTPPGSVGNEDELLHVGDPDVTFANGRLWLSYTKGCFDDCEVFPGVAIYGRGIFTRSSSDGVNWSAPLMASPRLDFAGGDLAHPLAPDFASCIMQRHPAVSGDAANGAVIAWEAPTFGRHPDTTTYSTLKVSANREPYAIDSTLMLTPGGPDYQNDSGRPSLVHYDDVGGTTTAVAWVERIPGTSPDSVAGVPRIKFNRSSDRLNTLSITPNVTPTVPDGDTTTIDDQPSLGIDGLNALHLVWLQGPEGSQVVRYATTSPNTFGDATADDPALVPAEPRHILAIDLLSTATEGIALQDFAGTILYDPDFANEIRWVGTGLWLSGGSAVPSSQLRPTFSQTGRLFHYSALDFLGPTLVDLDGSNHLFASDSFALGDVLSDLFYPLFSSSGRIVASRFDAMAGEHRVVHSDPASAHFTSIGSSVSGGSPSNMVGESYTGTYTAYEEQTGDVVVLDSASGTEVTRFLQSREAVWSPISNEILFVEHRSAPCERDALMEVDIAGGSTEHFVTNCDGAIQGPAYAQDGSDIAFACKLCGDAAADANGEAMIIKTLGHGDVPREFDFTDFSPVWSPDGMKIAFFQYSAALAFHDSMQLMIWNVGDAAATPHLGPAVGALPLSLADPDLIVRFPRLTWETIEQ